MTISYERQKKAVVEFTKQPERYINLALRSDLKIQLLLSMFRVDSTLPYKKNKTKLLGPGLIMDDY